MQMRTKESVVVWCGALVLLSCGRTRYVDEPGPCKEGDLRLSDEACSDERGYFYVERCTDETWVLGSECRADDDCEEGTERDLGENCGDYWYNRRVEVCRNGLLNTECICGSENPVEYDAYYDPWLDKPLPSFVKRIDILTTIDEEDLNHLKCADFLQGATGYSLPNFVAGGGVNVSPTMNVPKLRLVGSLSPRELNPEFYSVVDGVDEVGTFYANVGEGSGPVTGFKDLERLDSIYLYNHSYIEGVLDRPQVNFEGPLEVDAFSQFDSLESLTIMHTEIVSLEGLRNINSIAGDFTLAFLSSDEPLLALDGIEFIGGNVDIHGQYKGMICDVREWLERREIQGDIFVRKSPLSEVPACDE